MKKTLNIALGLFAIAFASTSAQADPLVPDIVEQYGRVLDNIINADTPDDIPDPIDSAPEPKDPPSEPSGPLRCEDLFNR